MIENPEVGMKVISNFGAAFPGRVGIIKVVNPSWIGDSETVGVAWDEPIGRIELYRAGVYTIHKRKLDLLSPAVRKKSGFGQFIEQQGL